MTMSAFVWLVPLFWMLSMSLSKDEALRINASSLIPTEFTLENFRNAFAISLVGRWFLNSVIVTVSTTVLTVALCAMAGYAFAQVPFRGRAALYALVLAGLMVPFEAVFIPLFTMFADADQHNTYHALILPRLASALGVFVMTQFFSKVPKEYSEAAMVDGAGRWTVFLRIMLPLARPALLALAIIVFVWTWNDYLWPLVSVSDREMLTITPGLASLKLQWSNAQNLGSIMARGVVGAAPVLIAFLLFQRHLIRGITLSSGEK
ncbi:MAG: carbohydrate ABC transporter permease [Micromonosporaceae bacterium]|nr:carbohydrate ABC transporter permease [Micromonosporaceae bacterium]